MAPLIERLAELEAEVEDLRRRGENQARIGTVYGVDYGARRCRVAHGELRTPWIKYFNPAAGDISETRHPSMGEQCLLLNYAGGDGSAQTVALLGIESEQYPGTSDSAELNRRIYPDGTAISYDHAAHELAISIGPTSITGNHQQLELKSNGSGLLINAAGVTMIGPRLNLQSDGSGLVADGSGLALAGSSVTHDGKNIGATHKHPGDSGGTTGTPQ